MLVVAGCWLPPNQGPPAHLRCSYAVIAASVGGRIPPEAHYLELALQPEREVDEGFARWTIPPRTARWGTRRFPLRVSIQKLPQRFRSLEDDVREAIATAAREWTGVIDGQIPSFVITKSTASEISVEWVAHLSEGRVGQLDYTTTIGGMEFDVEALQLPLSLIESEPPDLESLRRITRHEVGHALGIAGHSDQPADTMFPTDDPTQQRLSERDKNTLRMIYACPKNSIWIPEQDATTPE